MIEHLCGEVQGEEVMHEIENVITGRGRAMSDARSGTETNTQTIPDPVSVRADLMAHPCLVPSISDLSVVTTQVA